jgi:hypothetical protein
MGVDPPCKETVSAAAMLIGWTHRFALSLTSSEINLSDITYRLISRRLQPFWDVFQPIERRFGLLQECLCGRWLMQMIDLRIPDPGWPYQPLRDM